MGVHFMRVGPPKFLLHFCSWDQRITWSKYEPSSSYNNRVREVGGGIPWGARTPKIFGAIFLLGSREVKVKILASYLL